MSVSLKIRTDLKGKKYERDNVPRDKKEYFFFNHDSLSELKGAHRAAKLMAGMIKINQWPLTLFSLLSQRTLVKANC